MRQAGAAVLAVIGLASIAAADSAAPPKVPLIAGLITVSAVHEPDKGDYESILKIDAVSADLVGYTLAANVEDRRVTVRRNVKRKDMAHAHGWRPRYNEGIGGAASNQDLSTRRAQAVREALVSRYRIAADRLARAGFGATRPKETNDTLEGRARNRRVELVRKS